MSSNKTLTLKLTIDKKANKVLFGEANKDLVDFLFSIMSLPVGTLITSLSKQNMVGCLGELYGSIEKLNETYIQLNINKDSILQTKSVYTPLLFFNQPTTTCRVYYYTHFFSCDKCPYITNVSGSKICPSCMSVLRRDSRDYQPPAATTSTSYLKGYVRGGATYLVMDDLAVMPMSTKNFITLLNQFNVQDVGALEEKVVNLGMKEGLMLLKASLQSKTVLTDLFLTVNTEVISE